MARIDAILARLARLYPRAIDLSLDRVAGLLQRLGSPQDRLPPVIHVAGTNGKGSTIATMRACLEAAGYSVHVYTSPHLVSLTERIRLAGRLIDEARMIALIEEVEARNAGHPVTVFEVLTAAAFTAFASHPADILLLETGLGGRLDATNLVSQPVAAAITPVSMDHMAFLGEKLEQIAGEKAGILKPGCPAVIGPQFPRAAAVIEARAQAIGAPLYRHGSEWQAMAEGTEWHFEGARWQMTLPRPSLAGRHQIDNAGLALACLEQLDGFEIPEAALRQGMREIEWPARLQCLDGGRLAALLPPGWSLWLDGGHNAGAGEALAEVAAEWSNQPLDLVIGMLNNRDPWEFIRPLAPYLRRVFTVTIPGEANSHTANALAKSLSDKGVKASAVSTVYEAIAAIVAADPLGPARVLVTGSLYLAGDVLAHEQSSEPLAISQHG